MEKNMNNEFIREWLEGRISKQDLQSKKEQGDNVVQQFEELITRTAGMKVPESTSKADAWKKLSARISAQSNIETKPEAKVVRINSWVSYSIAASVSLLAVVFFVFSKTTVSTQFAETKVLSLPDGSEVTLNANSELTAPRFAWIGERKVTLKGEAFFNVTKGNTFTVESEVGTVTVLGTSFNVNARASLYEVACYTGKVKVRSNDTEVMLTQGLFTSLKEQKLTEPELFDVNKTTWRTGDFYFEGKPLRIVFDELERQFGIEITFDGDDTRLYTGYFSNKNIEQALDMVCKPMALKYQRQQNKIVIE